MTCQPVTDAVEMARALRIRADWKGGLRMLRTDAYFLLLLFRMRQFCLRWHIPAVNWVLRVGQMVFGSIELGNKVTLGAGVYFIHSLGIVIGGDAKIGARVRFMGNNTVGTADDNGYPVIEDDVEVGCGARILGPVRVGARARIGANAVVIADVPADAVAVGVPARIIQSKSRPTAPKLQIVVNGEIGS